MLSYSMTQKSEPFPTHRQESQRRGEAGHHQVVIARKGRGDPLCHSSDKGRSGVRKEGENRQQHRN